MKNCYVLRHVPFESLGLLEPLLVARGMAIHTLDVPLQTLPKTSLADADLVVVLGGPISVYEESIYPFLNDELYLIEQRLRRDAPTIGICLGAQLMARALGAKVYPGTEKEIGWSPLQLTDAGRKSPLSQLEGNSVLHWHGDTFDLPQGAELLASTETTPHQAFAWGKRCVALQFHIEVTARELEAWYVGHTLELAKWARMSVPALRSAGIDMAARLEPHASRAMGIWLDELLGPE